MMAALGKCSTLVTHLLIQKKMQTAVAVVDYRPDCLEMLNDGSLREMFDAGRQA